MADFATLVLGAETAGLKQAKPALEGVTSAAKKAQVASAQLRAEIARQDAELKKLRASGAGASDGARALSQSMADLRAKLAGVKAEAAAAAVAVQGAGKAADNSAGQVGNLTAQVFDITMMMQAGQNPFQLMLQQGSQVAQVIGPMGATGALQAFKGVFLQLLSPVNLATFGIIGLTAAIVPMIASMFESKDAGEQLKETTEALADATERYRTLVAEAGAPLDALGEKYGALTAVAAEALANQRLLAEDQALDLLAQKVDLLAGSLGALESRSITTARGTTTYLESFTRLRFEFGLTQEAASAVYAALVELSNAEGPQATADAARNLRAELEAAFGTASNMPAPIRELYNELDGAVLAAAELQGGLDEAGRAAEIVNKVAGQINSTIASADGSALQAAFAGAFPLANQLLGMAQGIVATLNKARADAAQMQFDRGNKQYSGRGADPRQFMPGGPKPFNPSDDVVKAADAMINPSGAGGGGGGGRDAAAAAAEKEAQAIQKVVDNLKSEIQQVGASDAARRLHQELQKAGVTIYSEEGQKIAALVEQLTELEAKQKLVAETMKGIENAAQGFFVGVLSGAKDLKSAIGDLLRQLGNLFLNQAFQMLWNGKAGGKGGLGGLIAGLFDMGGHIPAGQVGLVAEKRPEVVDGKLVTRPTLVSGPADVVGGAKTAKMMAPGPQTHTPRRSAMFSAPAPRVTVTPPPVVVLDDPRRIDAWNRSPQGERTAAWQQRRMSRNG